MARTAQFTAKKLVAFSFAEAEVLAFMAEQRNVTVSDVIREAVRLLGKHDGALDRRALAKRLQKAVAAQPAGGGRDTAKRDVDGFLAFLNDGRGIAAKAGPMPTRAIDSAKLFGD